MCSNLQLSEQRGHLLTSLTAQLWDALLIHLATKTVCIDQTLSNLSKWTHNFDQINDPTNETSYMLSWNQSISREDFIWGRVVMEYSTVLRTTIISWWDHYIHTTILFLQIPFRDCISFAVSWSTTYICMVARVFLIGDTKMDGCRERHSKYYVSRDPTGISRDSLVHRIAIARSPEI